MEAGLLQSNVNWIFNQVHGSILKTFLSKSVKKDFNSEISKLKLLVMYEYLDQGSLFWRSSKISNKVNGKKSLKKCVGNKEGS